ncbi:zinc finger protein interacting with ribonucleoprotein K-like [Bacillus rossius redtenbacheri]|uniref:zinc finger protein interacting with ribonucleoprotein K-like n=1 Tax=Bacillus rossius redtenbacheri TaxID=93214 RepID=UPI002FDCBCD9
MLKTSNGLEYHIQHHTGKNVLCVACGKLFYTVSHLKKHTARHHDPTPKEPGENFECLHCSRKYATKASLRNHIMIVHLKEMPYECEECGLKFTLRYRLNRHVACHKQRKFWCDCNQSFVTKDGLNRHKMTHVNFRPYVCDMCGLTFTQKGSVLRHIVTSMRGRTRVGELMTGAEAPHKQSEASKLESNMPMTIVPQHCQAAVLKEHGKIA